MPAVNVTDPVHETLGLLVIPRPLIVIEGEKVPPEVEEMVSPLPAGKVIVNWAP